MGALSSQEPEGAAREGAPGQAASAAGDGQRAIGQERQRFRTAVQRQAARRERFRREGFRGFWFGLSSFGMVGWSIAVPTLLGIALGLWLDRRLGGGLRFTISLMVAGLALGMTNVWRWIRLQQEAEEEATADEPGAGGDAGAKRPPGGDAGANRPSGGEKPGDRRD